MLQTCPDVIERYGDTGLYVGDLPGPTGPTARAKRSTSSTPTSRQFIALICEDGTPELRSEYVGTRTVGSDRQCRQSRFSGRVRWPAS